MNSPTSSEVRADGPSTEPEKIRLFDLPICDLTFTELCEQISQRIQTRKPGYVVTPNVDHVCRYHRNPDFRAAYDHATHVVVDGMPLLWFSRLFGRPLREKLSGSDLLPMLSAYAAEKGHSVYYLGAAEGVADEVALRLGKAYPGLRVAGTYSPPFGFEKDPAANEEILRRLREARPDICFVALGSPKQEIWLHRNHEASGVPVMLGVGAAFDFVAGRIRRAPVWMQNAGLEWCWRLACEPRRLAWRYLVDDSYFFVVLWRHVFGATARPVA